MPKSEQLALDARITPTVLVGRHLHDQGGQRVGDRGTTPAIRPIVGHRFTLDMGQWGKQACEVTEVEVHKVISYIFADGSLDTKVTWRLIPEGTGTRLLLEHEGFDLDSPMGRQAYDGMGDGWPKVLSRIDGILGESDIASR